MAAKGDEALLGHVKILNCRADRRDKANTLVQHLRHEIFSEVEFVAP